MLAANAAHHNVVLVGCHRQDNSREHMNNRRSIFRSALALMAAMICFDVTPALANGPALQRITMATFTSADLAGVERDYARWLGYQVRERGVVSPELAKAWGAPGAAGKRYLLLSSEPSPDVFVRVIEGKAAPADLLPLTTWGWNGIEIIIGESIIIPMDMRTLATTKSIITNGI